jgi:hypothetical protein
MKAPPGETPAVTAVARLVHLAIEAKRMGVLDDPRLAGLRAAAEAAERIVETAP